MTKGIQITDNVDIPRAQDTDFVINTKFLSGLKITDIHIFRFVESYPVQIGSRTVQGFNYAHHLGYVPAYLPFMMFGNPANPNDLSAATGATIPFNGFEFGNNNNFVNVDSQFIHVGFGSGPTSDVLDHADAITVIIFEEKIADS